MSTPELSDTGAGSDSANSHTKKDMPKKRRHQPPRRCVLTRSCPNIAGEITDNEDEIPLPPSVQDRDFVPTGPQSGAETKTSTTKSKTKKKNKVKERIEAELFLPDWARKGLRGVENNAGSQEGEAAEKESAVNEKELAQCTNDGTTQLQNVTLTSSQKPETHSKTKKDKSKNKANQVSQEEPGPSNQLTDAEIQVIEETQHLEPNSTQNEGEQHVPQHQDDENDNQCEEADDQQPQSQQQDQQLSPQPENREEAEQSLANETEQQEPLEAKTSQEENIAKNKDESMDLIAQAKLVDEIYTLTSEIGYLVGKLKFQENSKAVEKNSKKRYSISKKLRKIDKKAAELDAAREKANLRAEILKSELAVEIKEIVRKELIKGDATGRPTRKVPTRPKVVSTIEVRPTDNKNRADLEDELAAHPRTSGAPPVRIKPTSRGIELKFSSHEDKDKALETLKNNELLREKATFQEKQPKIGTVIIQKVPARFNEHDIKQRILDLDRIINEKEIDVVKPYTIRRGRRSWQVKLPVMAKLNLLRIEYIIFDYAECKVQSFINIGRCQFCQAFKHNSNDCPRINKYCPICAGDHSKEACENSDVPRCVNCLRINQKHGNNYNTYHRADSFNCPAYKQYKKLVLEEQGYERNNRQSVAPQVHMQNSQYSPRSECGRRRHNSRSTIGDRDLQEELEEDQDNYESEERPDTEREAPRQEEQEDRARMERTSTGQRERAAYVNQRKDHLRQRGGDNQDERATRAAIARENKSRNARDAIVGAERVQYRRGGREAQTNYGRDHRGTRESDTHENSNRSHYRNDDWNPQLINPRCNSGHTRSVYYPQSKDYGHGWDNEGQQSYRKGEDFYEETQYYTEEGQTYYNQDLTPSKPAFSKSYYSQSRE